MAAWAMAQTGPASALAWMESLPIATRTNQPVALLIADCRNLLNDWPGLKNSIEGQDGRSWNSCVAR
jgi:hypothetical protein